jgi:hypothetical protein
MIGVGINENVYLAGVSMNEKHALILSFKETDGSEKNIIEMLEDDEVGSLASGSDIRLFPFNVPNKADMTAQQKFDIVINDIKNTGSLLVHLLSPFLTKDELKLDKYANTGIKTTMPMADFQAKILSQAVLDTIWKNMATAFIRLSKPLVGNVNLTFRLKLRRQSKEKHYAALPNKFLNTEPCIEPMTVPKDQSKVKFSAYEIKEGLDKADQLPSSAADPLPTDTELPDNEFSDAMFEPPADLPADQLPL